MHELTAVLAQTRWDHMRGWDGGWMWLWGSLMMLTWVVVIAAAVWLVTRSSAGDRNSPARAREILDERLARGEIDLDEYRQRRDALR